MTGSLHPALILLGAGLLMPFLRGRARQATLLLAPLLGLANLLGFEAGHTVDLTLAGFELQPLRVDKLSLLFGYLFHIAAFLASIYSLHISGKDRGQYLSGLVYAASAVGTVFAGDLLTLFVFWELLAISSVFQIWARASQQSFGAGLRYLVAHILSGLLMLAAAVLQYQATGSLAFGAMDLAGNDPAAWLLLAAIGIKCAFPLLHSWLVDGYPAATPTGAVFLCAFTTKAAVYALARGFAGAGILIWIGSAMAMFPIFYAVIENDLRRVLGYSMINQIGFMVVGIGLGTDMGINGAVAHAFNDVFFKGLLFMSMGAVLFRTGRINGSDLGGLYKSMPWTAGFCMVGAASISAFPLFSGFVSKSMVMVAAADSGYLSVWLMLLFASAGVFHHAGIKIPFFAFFAHDSGLRPKEAPLNMLVAMGLAAVLCIGIGCNPSLLYALLPFEVDYQPYTTTHVLTQLQILFFSAMAFTVLMLTRIYPPELHSTNLDIDWLWRRALPRLLRAPLRLSWSLWNGLLGTGRRLVDGTLTGVHHLHGPEGVFARTWSTGSIALVAVVVLGSYLALYFFG